MSSPRLCHVVNRWEVTYELQATHTLPDSAIWWMGEPQVTHKLPWPHNPGCFKENAWKDFMCKYFATMMSLQNLQTLITLCVFLGGWLPRWVTSGSLTYTLNTQTSTLWQYYYWTWCDDDGMISYAKSFQAFLKNLSSELRENIWNKRLDSTFIQAWDHFRLWTV